MNMQQCNNGHFYDQSKFSQCPYCNSSANNDSQTVPLETAFEFDPISTGDDGFMSNGSDPGKTVAIQPNDSPTVAVFSGGDNPGKPGYDPVVGWLVCIDGASKGQDFRLFNGNNSLGRGASSRIRIPNDPAISQENAAYVAYDGISKKYYFQAGNGRNLIRVNEELLLPNQSRELTAFDRVRIGESTLLFIPLCGEAFNWD